MNIISFTKRLFLTILGSCSIIFLNGQNYSPLLIEENEWNVLSAGLSFPFPFDTVYQTVTYKLTGDTVLNSITYKKIYESWEEFPSSWALWSFLREDDQHKVWERRKDSDKEWLLYDFSLDAGDTVQVGEYPEILQIDSITTVTINGIERMKLWLSTPLNPEYHETWIEGIGSDKGIIWSGSVLMVGGYYQFLCLSNNGNLIYMDPEYTSCYIVTDVYEMLNEEIRLFPNPAANTLKIKNSGKARAHSISLYNMSGLQIKSFPPGSTELDVSGLPHGIYFLKISFSRDYMLRKIVIN